MKPFYAHVVCADGATVSIQASRFSYCKPRNDVGPYTHVEAGFPSVNPPESWMTFIDDDDPMNSVYGYMPVSVVFDFINAHGGMVGGELPPIAIPTEQG